MNHSAPTFRHQSGQVLTVGLVMLALLALILLYAFDVHNVIRAKFKVETAQEAAAIAAANWQKEALNLIGEINLFKAAALVLEEDAAFNPALPPSNANSDALRRQALQGRLDLLTEAQTRISFIVPLIGFAAAQQAAKANGLAGRDQFSDYLELLVSDKRYVEEFGGAPKVINSYQWKTPYMEMIDAIGVNGIAVYPNARIAGVPRTVPAILSCEHCYKAIEYLARAIAGEDPPEPLPWEGSLVDLVKTWKDSDFNRKWWTIDYASSQFPRESEIYTLGVEYGAEYTDTIAAELQQHFGSSKDFYQNSGALPGTMNWCRYDDWWYPDYYRNNYASYEASHFNYWFNGEVLRKEVKPQYRYEGPAAYAEGYADVGSVVKTRFRKGNVSEAPQGSSDIESQRRVALHTGKDSRAHLIERHEGRSAARVGTLRSSSTDTNISTSYRPGSIAKALGELKNKKPPIEIPLILPVFDQVSMMPTFMPIPYNFQVLKPGYAALEKFLNWLADQDSLDGTPPEGTERYLNALKLLVNGVQARSAGSSAAGVPVKPGTQVAGRGLRYYGYNPDFDVSAFEAAWKERLFDWYKARDANVFQQTRLAGPGWLQEPQLCRDNYSTPAKYTVTREDGTTADVIGIKNKKMETISELDPRTLKVSMPDNINGGTAFRIYPSFNARLQRYYVIDSKGKIVLNGEPDPTLVYNSYVSGGGGGDRWNPGAYDSQKGPARL